MCTPTQGVWQPAGCVSCELVCVCVSFVRVVIICLASTHTALVSSPSLAVLHLSTYLPNAAQTGHKRQATKTGRHVLTQGSLETLAGIFRRRHRNALLAPEDTPDVRVDTIYNEARLALIRTYAHTRRRALDEEKAIRLRIPGWQPSPGEGPVAEWETEWLA